ncbi:MAG: dTMP kinase [Clostridia bacterium]|nr:dTMP kinase [Clostridia bacterium]
MVGKFITIEGCDGSGKTTQSQLLEKYLRVKQVPCLFTREPGGTEISEQIRKIILNKENENMNWRTEALLYAASRAQLVGEKIVPALHKGLHVVCDRYIDSTLAYQGYGRGLSLEELKRINYFAAGGLKPDVTFLLDIDPEETFQRKARQEKDRLEKEKIEFHQKVRYGYLELARLEPERFKIIKATQSIEEIHREIVAFLEEVLF